LKIGRHIEEPDLSPAAIRAMARRQFKVSLVVGVAFLVLAGVRAASFLHETSPEMSARHNAVQIQTAGRPIAGSPLKAMSRDRTHERLAVAQP
jgi:hypothetical protein